jgi:hypothetical protein
MTINSRSKKGMYIDCVNTIIGFRSVIGDKRIGAYLPNEYHPI